MIFQNEETEQNKKMMKIFENQLHDFFPKLNGPEFPEHRKAKNEQLCYLKLNVDNGKIEFE